MLKKKVVVPKDDITEVYRLTPKSRHILEKPINAGQPFQESPFKGTNFVIHLPPFDDSSEEDTSYLVNYDDLFWYYPIKDKWRITKPEELDSTYKILKEE